MKKVFSTNDVRDMWDAGVGDEHNGLVKVHEGEWIDEGKYQCQELVFLDKETGKSFMYYVGRSGSYFSDYDFSFESEGDTVECTEVELKTKTIETWEAVTQA